MCEKLRKAARINSKLKRHSVVKLRVTRFEEHFVSSPTLNNNHVKPELWLRWPPILDSILQHLSGSESALLLSILHLLRDRQLVRKHVTPIRDLPEYADWIELMISKGHAVFLLGEDVDNLRFRLEKPQTYWAQGRGKNALRIWLLARTSKTATLAFKEQGRPFTDQGPGPSPRIAGKSRYWLTSDGDLQYPKTVEEVRHFRHLEVSGTVQLNGKLIPIPGMSHDIRGSVFRHTRSNWQRTTIKNSNSIDIVCADDCGDVYETEEFSQQITDPHITPMFEFCPTKRERQTAYLEKSHMRHAYGIAREDCHILGPGSLQLPRVAFQRPSSGFTLPYFCVQRNAYSFTKPLKSSLDIGKTRAERNDLDSVAVEVVFRCSRGQSAIYDEHQAVLW